MAKMYMSVTGDGGYGRNKKVEYTFPDGSGGLIDFNADGNRVELYRTDPGVKIHTGSDDIDTVITNLYSNTDNDGDHRALETILIRAGYQWRCHTTKTAGDRECGWVNRASDSECDACGVARGEHTRR